MMPGLQILLFGPPRLERGGQSIALGRSKALAMLAYLGRTQGMHTREALLDLLWPAFAPEDARNNLRRELSLLKRALPEAFLFADRQVIGLNPTAIRDGEITIDIRLFEAGLERARTHSHIGGVLCNECAAALESAAELYTDDFLAGFSLPDSPAFDEWQFHQSDNLRRALATALERLVGWNTERMALERALDHARRWVSVDPLHEPAHRALMRLYSADGQHTIALHHYENLRRMLQDELGVEPEPATEKLYDGIRARRVVIPDEADRGIPAGLTPIATKSPNNLPADMTPFIGREKELAQLGKLLADPSTRLITVLGIGGMGKTRLALAAAQRVVNWTNDLGFPDGVFFIPLAPVAQTSLIAPALALGLGFTPGGDGESSQQVINYLKPRRALLLVDNLEHLIDGKSAELFSGILSSAPGIKLLATSRVRVGLGGEHVFPLDGLNIGSTFASSAVGTFDETILSDAVRLFMEAARRVLPSFQLDESNYDAIGRICSLVGGMPLGIELAAGWIELLTPQAILEEIERSLDFLASSQTDTPERQASLKAVFDSSWRLLTTQEQRVLSYLSIFPGSFDRDAAEQVTGPVLQTGNPLRMLLSLTNKSWLQSAGANRYQIHPLLRQYVVQEPSDNSETEATLRDRHAGYFTALLIDLDERMRGRHSEAAFNKITLELDNIRAAILWLVGNNKLDQVVASIAIPLFRYLESRYHFYFFAPLLAEATRRAEILNRNRELGILSMMQAAFFFDGYPTRFLDYDWVGDEISDTMRMAWTLLQDDSSSTDFWSILLAWQYGRFVDMAVAVDRLRSLTARLENSEKGWEKAFAHQSLGRLLARGLRYGERYGHETEAGENLVAALTLFEALGDERETAITSLFLGFERQSAGAPAEAKEILLQAQERLRALGDEFIAASLNWQLGEIQMQLGEFEAALGRFHEMANIFLRSGRSQLAIAGLSRESYETVRYGDLAVALQLREQCLSLSRQVGGTFQEAWDCWEMGEVYRVMGHLNNARLWYERAQAIFLDIPSSAGQSFHYRGLGDLALAENQNSIAEVSFRHSIEWAEATHHPWQRAYSLAGLGKAVLAEGRLQEARVSFQESLRTIRPISNTEGLALVVISRISQLFSQAEKVERATELGRLVLTHPMSWHETRREMMTQFGFSPEHIPGRENTKPVDLTKIIEELIAELQAE